MSALDPFYLVKEEIQESVNKLQATFARWEQLPSIPTSDFVLLSRDLVTGCESIEWQVDELDRAIAVAEKDPARFSIDVAEVERRKKWTASTHNQVNTIRRALQEKPSSRIQQGRRELMRLPEDNAVKPSPAARPDVDNFNQESDRQALILKEQDDVLDEMSASVARIGGVGLTIYDELTEQDRIIEDLNDGMSKTSNRLEFVQKRLSTVMKRAGWKGQLFTILFLIALLVILTYLVFNA